MYNLPGMRNGTFRIFQVEGLSMYPTLQSGSYVVGQFVEDWEHISDNRIYVVVSTEGVIVKRVLNRIEKYGSLYCKSDNRVFPHINVRLNDVREIWECKMHLSFDFLDPVPEYQKIADLEAAMNWYKNEIDSYYLLKSDLPVRDLTNDEKIFVQDFITNYNQDILKLSSKYFMGRDGRNARMQSMNYSDIGNFKIIDEEKLSKRPEWIKDYTKDANVIVNTVTNIPYIASKKIGQNGKSLITINGVGVYTIQNINFEPIDKKMIKN